MFVQSSSNFFQRPPFSENYLRALTQMDIWNKSHVSCETFTQIKTSTHAPTFNITITIPQATGVLPWPCHGCTDRGCCQTWKRLQKQRWEVAKGCLLSSMWTRTTTGDRERQPEEFVSPSTPTREKSQLQYLVLIRGIPISKKSNMTLRLTGCKSEYSGWKTLPKCHQAIRHKIRLAENVTYSAGSENGCGC